MKILFVVCLFIFSACQPALNHQPKLRADAQSDFFSDRAAARNLPQGVVEFRRQNRPVPTLTMALLQRGRARYDIHCSVCHGLAGNAEGVAGTRGFKDIPSLVSTSALALPETAIAHIVQKGQGRMFALGNRISENDAYAIASYVKALQLSQHAIAKNLPGSDQKKIAESKP